MPWSLARIPIPFRKRIYALRQGIRRVTAIRHAAARGKAVVRQVTQLKSAHPDRPFYGILLVEHLGDIIACEPVIAWARRQSSNAFVIWIVKDVYAELLSSHPGLDAVITVKSLASAAPIIDSNVFDIVVDLHINKKPTGIRDVVHTKTRGDPSVDSVNYFRERSLLRAFTKAGGIPQLSQAPTIYASESTVRSVDSMALPDRFVVVHTTSNDDARDWSVEEWSKLVRYIIEEGGLAVIEIGLQQTLTIDHPQFVSLCGELSLTQTAEVIRRAIFFVGVDSGPAHMANAWRRPSLLLFGRFHGEDSWCPYDGFFAEEADNRIHRHPGPLRELRADEVIERLKSDDLWLSAVADDTSPFHR